MKVYLLFLFFSIITTTSICQSSGNAGEAFYMLDAKMKGTDADKAVYFIHVFKVHDSCWQFDTYNILGPIISSEQYKDNKGSEAGGMFCYYNKKGKVDSSGMYQNGFQQGSWYFINDTGRYYMLKEYDAGRIITVKDIIKIDSIRKLEEANKTIKPDSTEKEADFVGGQSRWIYYLGKHMVYPERALKADKQGTVVVQFIIDEDGNVTYPEIVRSVEYSLDQEAIRLIKNSPTWIPGEKNGKKVKSYKMQPITFKFEAN
ncbi:MAG: energy transducer TonB [Chitinophagaceae bacterium]